MKRSGLVLAGILACFVPSLAHADTLIGSWENATDGWIDWATQAAIVTPKYTYSATGATVGSSALLLTQNGYNQNLAIKLQDTAAGHADFRTDFFANNALAIDITTPASTVSGYSQIYQIALNAPGFGFAGLTASPVPGAQWGWGGGGGPAATHSLVFDYSAALGSISPSAGYVEFIFSTNNDGLDTHGQFFIDNARLVTIPEPTSLALLAGVGVMALRRKR